MSTPAGGAPTPDDPRRCTARRSSGDPCRAWAIRGGSVCAVHGGRAPQVRQRAARRLEEDRQAALVARTLERRLGGEVDLDPAEALELAVRRTGAMVEVLAELLAQVPAERAPTKQVKTIAGVQHVPTGPGLYGPNHLGDDAAHVLFSMYRAALVDLGRVAGAAHAAGISERGQALAEAEGAMIAAALDAVVRDPRLGLEPAQRRTARALLADRLLALEAEVVSA